MVRAKPRLSPATPLNLFVATPHLHALRRLHAAVRAFCVEEK